MKKSSFPKMILLSGLVLAIAVLAFTLPSRIAAQGETTPPEPGVADNPMSEARSESNLAPLAPVGTGFTYQGRLEDGGSLADGAYDFQFSLFDAAAAGIQIGSTITLTDVTVAEGLFSVDVDFGTSAFGGGARWLEIAVRPGASTGVFMTLTPRQELSPAPYAMAMPNVYTNEGVNFVGIGRDFRISGNEVFGVRYPGGPNEYGGMYVETANAGGWPFYGYATNGSFRAWTYYNGTSGEWSLYNAGIRLKVPASGGLRIGPSADYSLVISNTTGADGIRIMDTGDDGIQIGSDPDYPNYGVYIPSPGVSTYGLWPNTADAAGQWALFTVDNIEAGNVFASAFSIVAKVSGSDPVSTGDLVAVEGVSEPVPGGTNPLPLVRMADSESYNGVIGVVTSRMVWDLAPGKETEGEMSMHSADGLAQPGDYVSLMVYGVADLKIDPQAQITAGDRLTASSLAGAARPLREQEVNGMMITEGAPVIGIALSAPAEGQTTIPVFVTLR
jgi:hypothetical protein